MKLAILLTIALLLGAGPSFSQGIATRTTQTDLGALAVSTTPQWSELPDPWNANYANSISLPLAGPDGNLYVYGSAGVACYNVTTKAWSLVTGPSAAGGIEALTWNSQGQMVVSLGTTAAWTGLFVQTAPGTWTQATGITISGGQNAAPGVDCLASDGAGNLYAGVRPSTAIWKSTNGGPTWTNDTAAPIDTAVEIMAAAEGAKGEVLFTGAAPNIVLETANGGPGWTQNYPAETKSDSYAITTDPADNPYVGFSDEATGNVLWKSTPNGTTWTPVSAGLPPYSFPHGIVADSAGDIFVAIVGKSGVGGGVYEQSAGATKFSLVANWPANIDSQGVVEIGGTLYAVQHMASGYAVFSLGGAPVVVTPPPPPTESFTISPATVTVGDIGDTLNFAGTLTNWSASPFTLTGGTGAAITSQAVTSTGAATATINVGTATGTLTFTDGVASATVTVNGPTVAQYLASLTANVSLAGQLTAAQGNLTAANNTIGQDATQITSLTGQLNTAQSQLASVVAAAQKLQADYGPFTADDAALQAAISAVGSQTTTAGN